MAGAVEEQAEQELADGLDRFGDGREGGQGGEGGEDHKANMIPRPRPDR